MNQVHQKENNSGENFIMATFNVRYKHDDEVPEHHWSKRIALCREVVEKNQFDLFGLQEPYREQIDDLIRDTDYAFIGSGRDDFKDKGEFSCIVYRKSRFEVLKGGTFGLSEKPDQPGFRSWNSACPRISSWGLFRDKITGKELIYYNSHLDHWSELARINGIRLLVKHARENAFGKPLVISGDFNAYPDSETYRAAAELLHDSKYVSETPHQGPEFTFHRWGENPEKEPIDYIFVSDGIQVHSHRTDDTVFDGAYASDHYPIVIRVSLR